jgi:hypothetical protein
MRLPPLVAEPIAGRTLLFLGRVLENPTPSSMPSIHPSAENRNSANFACTEFSEVQVDENPTKRSGTYESRLGAYKPPLNLLSSCSRSVSRRLVRSS